MRIEQSLPCRLGLFLALALPAVWLSTGSELPRTQPAEVNLSAEALAKIGQSVQGFLDRSNIAGAITVITRHGKIAYSGTAGFRDRERQVPMTEDTIFRIYSMSKPITG